MTSASHSSLSAGMLNCTQELFRYWSKFWKHWCYYSFKTVEHTSKAEQACLDKLAHYTKFQRSVILYKHTDGSQATNLWSAYQRSQLCGTGMFQIHLDTSSTVLRITSQSLKHYLTIGITAYSFEQVWFIQMCLLQWTQNAKQKSTKWCLPSHSSWMASSTGTGPIPISSNVCRTPVTRSNRPHKHKQTQMLWGAIGWAHHMWQASSMIMRKAVEHGSICAI